MKFQDNSQVKLATPISAPVPNAMGPFMGVLIKPVAKNVAGAILRTTVNAGGTNEWLPRPMPVPMNCPNGNVISISEFEKSVTEMAILGFSINEIAVRTKLKTKSVAKLLENAYRKIELTKQRNT